MQWLHLVSSVVSNSICGSSNASGLILLTKQTGIHTHRQFVQITAAQHSFVRCWMPIFLRQLSETKKMSANTEKKMDEKKLYESIVELYTNVCMQIEEEKNQNWYPTQLNWNWYQQLRFYQPKTLLQCLIPTRTLRRRRKKQMRTTYPFVEHWNDGHVIQIVCNIYYEFIVCHISRTFIELFVLCDDCSI